MKELREKVALITGAGSGFGKEFAKEAFKRGMRLFLVDINREAVEQTARQIREAGGTAQAFMADVSLETGVNAMVDEAMACFGQIDLLINNAGIMMGGSVVDLPGRDWEWTIQVNCMSQVYAMKRVIPIMKQQGTSCHIVNVASVAGLVPSHKMPAYTATKQFCVGLTESVCLELQESAKNIRMSVFCPGFVKTSLHKYEESRPRRFQAAAEDFYSSEAYRNIQKQAQENIREGSSLDTIAPTLFDGIEADRFYILPHKSYLVLIRNRLGNIINGHTPDVQLYNAASAYERGDKSPSVLKILRDALRG